MASSGSTLRRAVFFAAAFGGGVSAALAVCVLALRAGPDRYVELSGPVFATALAALLGAALALVFSPRHGAMRTLLDALLAAALWLGFTYATWALVLPMLDNVVGVGLLFVWPELLACWSLLGAGLIVLVCVPWVRRETTRRPGVVFVVAGTGTAVALGVAVLWVPWFIGWQSDEQARADAAPARPSDSAPPAGTGAFDLEVRAHLRFVPTGDNQTIASRPLYDGQVQFPWVFRVDPQGHLAAGINLVGTDLTWCTAASSVPAGEHDVALELRDQQVRLALDREEVARCPVVGALTTSGDVLWGRVRHFRSPDELQGFAGELSSTFARETLRH